MYADDLISFEERAPDQAQILDEVKKISGLDHLNWNDQNNAFSHPEFTKRLFLILMNGKTIRLIRGWDELCYLLDATINALVNLGGTFEGQIPEIGQRKWCDVKDQYPEPLHFSEFSDLIIEAEFKFEGVPPTSAEIVAKINELSGLAGVSSRYMNAFEWIAQENFMANKVFMAQADHRVCLFGKGNRPNYMLEIAIASLISLGGHYLGDQKNWTREKWENVKNQFPGQ